MIQKSSIKIGESFYRTFAMASTPHLVGFSIPLAVTLLDTGKTDKVKAVVFSSIAASAFKTIGFPLYLRAWSWVQWGRNTDPEKPKALGKETFLRSAAKIAAWQTFTFALDTVAFYGALQDFHEAAKVAAVKSGSYFVLLMANERIWAQFKWGISVGLPESDQKFSLSNKPASNLEVRRSQRPLMDQLSKPSV